MEENKSQQQTDNGHEQDGHADAREQEKSRPENQQTNKCNCLDCIKQLANWLISPVKWFYRIDPVAKFTFILCFVGAMQVWAFVESERAFIYPWVTLSQNALSVGKQIVVTLNTHNGGHSGAFLVDANVTYSLEPLPKEPHYIRGDVNAVSGPLPAGMAVRGETPLHGTDGKPLIPDQTAIDALTNGTIPFYVFGWVKYTDAFSWFGPKISGFCGKYTPGHSPDNAFYNCGQPAYVYAR